jgi:hypothetical protein
MTQKDDKRMILSPKGHGKTRIAEIEAQVAEAMGEKVYRPKPHPSKLKAEWEKEIRDGIRHWVMLSDIKTGVNWSAFESGLVSDFTHIFTSRRQDLLKELRGEVEGKKKPVDDNFYEEEYGYNQALQDVIKLLESKNE